MKKQLSSTPKWFYYIYWHFPFSNFRKDKNKVKIEFVIKPPILSIEIAEFGREFEREREEKTETTKNLSLLLDTAVIPHIYIDG